jgi:transcriptional regulator with XRE-family HTH domain
MDAGKPSAFGSLLRACREAAGLSQERLAERAGLSLRGISDLERGRGGCLASKPSACSPTASI